MIYRPPKMDTQDWEVEDGDWMSWSVGRDDFPQAFNMWVTRRTPWFDHFNSGTPVNQ